MNKMRARTFRGFYKTQTIEPGQSVRFEFENDCPDGEFVWLAIGIRLLGFTREQELFRLDCCMVRLFMSPSHKLEDIKEGVEWVQVEEGFNDLPASMCQEPHLFKMPRPPVMRQRPEEDAPPARFGIDIDYGEPPPDLSDRTLRARVALLGLETRDLP